MAALCVHAHVLQQLGAHMLTCASVAFLLCVRVRVGRMAAVVGATPLQSSILRCFACLFVLDAGKTTQLPQIILDYMCETGQGAMCNIVCTQPRRIRFGFEMLL